MWLLFHICLHTHAGHLVWVHSACLKVYHKFTPEATSNQQQSVYWVVKLVIHALVNMKSAGNKNNSQAGDSVNGQIKQPDLLQWQIYRNVLLEETGFWHHADGKMCYLESQSPISHPMLSFRKFSNNLQQQGRLGTVPVTAVCFLALSWPGMLPAILIIMRERIWSLLLTEGPVKH